MTFGPKTSQIGSHALPSPIKGKTPPTNKSLSIASSPRQKLQTSSSNQNARAETKQLPKCSGRVRLHGRVPRLVTGYHTFRLHLHFDQGEHLPVHYCFFQSRPIL